MRISDWSSDVCSSDLAVIALNGGAPRTMSLTRAAGSYRIEGALPLVHELLGAERVSLNTVTADNRPLSTQFDLRGLKDTLSGYDFYCANSWLAANEIGRAHV